MTAAELTLSVYRPPRARRPWRLDGLLGHSRLRYFSLGRLALAEALRLAGARGKEVLVPDLICAEVLEAVSAAGARSRFYPVSPDLSATGLDGLGAAAAAISVNYFGFPQDLAPFEAHGRRHGSVLIEDNAHGLFSRDSQGRLLGGRAALGIFSLRKSMPLPNGAALAVNAQGLLAQAGPQVPFQDAGSPRALGKTALRRLSPGLGAANTLWLLRLVRPCRVAAVAAAPGPCRQIENPLTAADPEAEVERRRGLYQLCAGLLSPVKVRPVFPELPAGVAPYAYPFRAGAEQAQEAESRLNRRGLFSLPWPELPREIAGRAPEHYRDLRLAHFLW